MDANGEWRRLHNEELHSLYRSPNMTGHVARMGEGRSAFKILTDKPTGDSYLERPRCRWNDNIRKDLKVIGMHTRNWVDSAPYRDYWRALVNSALKLRVS